MNSVPLDVPRLRQPACRSRYPITGKGLAGRGGLGETEIPAPFRTVLSGKFFASLAFGSGYTWGPAGGFARADE
jgi:hypothetical protein